MRFRFHAEGVPPSFSFFVFYATRWQVFTPVPVTSFLRTLTSDLTFIFFGGCTTRFGNDMYVHVLASEVKYIYGGILGRE